VGDPNLRGQFFRVQDVGLGHAKVASKQKDGAKYLVWQGKYVIVVERNWNWKMEGMSNMSMAT
jgi:hypothetical protein